MLKVRNAKTSTSAIYIYIYIYKCALTFFLLFLLSIVFNFNSTFAESVNYDVIIDPTLSLTLSSDTVSFNLNPVSQSFNSGNLTASVATNNPNGYKLYLTTANDATNLLRQKDGTPADGLNAVIETLDSKTGGYTEAEFTVNKWGYRISSGTSGEPSITSATNYFPYTSNTLISSSSIPTNNESATLTFGAKADYNKPSGQYNLDLNFKALPQVTQKYMQEIETADCTEDPTMVMDKRDGHLYAIARLKDGKCWMVQNLRLGEGLADVSGSITLTSVDSNVSSDFVLTNKVVPPGIMPNTQISDSKAYKGESGVWDGQAFYCTDNYGCYYNWYTATAGLGKQETTSGDVTDSICPSGWLLPSGDESGDFTVLANAYGFGVDDNDTVSARLLVDPQTITQNINGAFLPGILKGGHYSGAGTTTCSLSGGACGVNVFGSYWSRTAYSPSLAYNFIIRSTAPVPASHDNNGKSDARSVRCLFQE